MKRSELSSVQSQKFLEEMHKIMRAILKRTKEVLKRKDQGISAYSSISSDLANMITDKSLKQLIESVLGRPCNFLLFNQRLIRKQF